MLATTRRLLFCAAALALAATACGSATGIETERVRREPVVQNAIHPLTGIAYGEGEDWQSRPALAIKIGNAPPERPQAGLDKADLVYEELVEGGMTRFMAVFSTNEADRVGPVRSARKVDPELLAPMGASFAYSGGAPSTIAVLQSSSGFTDVGINRVSGAYRRDPNRSSPYNLYTSTSALWSARSGSPPPALFSFLEASDDPGAGSQEVAQEVRFSFAGSASEIRFAYDAASGTYRRHVGGSAHLAEGSVPLAFRNVVVQFVNISAGYSVDKAGFRSNDIATVGSGELIVIRGGKALRGRWERSSASQAPRFLDASGAPIALAPGNTMVELLPAGRPVAVS